MKSEKSPGEVSKKKFFRSFVNIFWLVCRDCWHDSFLLTKRRMLGGAFRYLEHVRKVRKFFRGLWKNFHLKKWVRNKAQNGVRIFWRNRNLFSRNFFQKPLETLLWTSLYEYFWGIWKVYTAWFFASVKKIVTIRHQ